MDHQEITVLLVARNASETIARAIRSVRSQAKSPILLIDDHSSDGTADLARKAAQCGLEVLRPDAHGPLGATRHFGLLSVKTPYTLLLDADDVFRPGHIDQFIFGMLSGEFDVWACPIELVSEASGDSRRILEIPSFINSMKSPYRLLERNYLPGVGQIGFKTRSGLKAGYDWSLHGAEDLSLCLRMLLDGASFTYGERPTYRMYVSDKSVSRNLKRQRLMCSYAVRQYGPDFLEAFYFYRGAKPAEVAYGKVLLSCFQRNYQEAYRFARNLLFLDESADPEARSTNGPSDLRLWRYWFYRGTLEIMLGDNERARGSLEACLRVRESADCLNNLGCALRALGDERLAHTMFVKAIEVYTRYADAAKNLRCPDKIMVTLPELRAFPSRDDYPVSVN